MIKFIQNTKIELLHFWNEKRIRDSKRPILMNFDMILSITWIWVVRYRFPWKRCNLNSPYCQLFSISRCDVSAQKTIISTMKFCFHLFCKYYYNYYYQESHRTPNRNVYSFLEEWKRFQSFSAYFSEFNVKCRFNTYI